MVFDRVRAPVNPSITDASDRGEHDRRPAAGKVGSAEHSTTISRPAISLGVASPVPEDVPCSRRWITPPNGVSSAVQVKRRFAHAQTGKNWAT